ncbi:MAG TPA: TetR/AcrR family transcriptional regulator [Candidatus Binataceae bacterium]|nr:TetR/AcrR family transcriptional regulator [Candidatus Binataceae bacterium]
MARIRPANRISSLIDAAVRVFSAKGYRRAQMADIAREMGVSPGLLYNYVESKEALFYLVVDQGIGQEPCGEPLSLPVRTPPPGAITKRIAERFRKELGMPALSAALKHPRAEDPLAELEAVVRELYASAYRYGDATTMLERSALDMPELAALFYGKMRPSLVSRLTRFIELRIEAGQFRCVPYPAVAARLILETVTWFARNRRGDPASQDISDQVAEEATVDFLVNSLVPPSARARTVRLEKQAATHR